MIDDRTDIDRCLVGDVRAVLPTLPNGCVQCIVTSPPFWGLRSYLPDGHADKHRELGAEPLHDCLGWATSTPCGECYVCALVGVCRELRRVLRPDGTFWLELGDSYANDGKWGGSTGGKHVSALHGSSGNGRGKRTSGLKPKDLCGIPWRVALALQADGWWLRSDIVWARPNPMPESVTDRPTKSHSYVFLLAKSEHYFYDAEAIKETVQHPTVLHKSSRKTVAQESAFHGNAPTNLGRCGTDPAGRNARSVWVIPTQAFAGVHFATWPEALVKRCILAGTSEAGCCAECGAQRERIVERIKHPTRDGEAQRRADAERTGRTDGHVSGPAGMIDSTRTTGWRPTCACDADSVPCTVLDPFMGSGTTAQVAQDLGRHWLGIELNPAYLALQARRTAQTGLPLLAGRDEP